MIYSFTEQQKSKIIEDAGYDFYRIVHYSLIVLSKQWKLFGLEFFDGYFNGNAIFFCKSEPHGDCVLKIYGECDEALDDYNALREHNGGYFVKAFEYDEYGAILVERAVPGKMLSDEPSLEKRLAVFSELFNGRHIAPKNPQLFDTYANRLNHCVNLIENKREDFKELYFHAIKAREIYTKMESVYDRKLLIHLDLCGVNIVSCGNGKYKIIDPSTVIGDPVIETGRFIHVECYKNEIERGLEKTKIALDYFEKNLNIPNKILRQCLYLEAVFSACERTQWGGFGERIFNKILFAEKLMNES